MRQCRIASGCKILHRPCCVDCKDRSCKNRCQNSPERCGCWESLNPRPSISQSPGQSRKSKIDRQELLRLHNLGLLQREIAERVGYSASMVSAALREMGVRRYGYDKATYAQNSVIGSMLIDERCVPLVLSKLREEDFIDPICRNFFRAIRELVLEGRPVDPVTVMGKLKSGDDYVRWAREVMEITLTATNVGEYIPEVRKAARWRTVLDLASKLPEADDDELEALVRKMSIAMSATDRMLRMTGSERFEALYKQLKNPEKPKYLPWGIPTVDRVA